MRIVRVNDELRKLIVQYANESWDGVVHPDDIPDEFDRDGSEVSIWIRETINRMEAGYVKINWDELRTIASTNFTHVGPAVADTIRAHYDLGPILAEATAPEPLNELIDTIHNDPGILTFAILKQRDGDGRNTFSVTIGSDGYYTKTHFSTRLYPLLKNTYDEYLEYKENKANEQNNLPF